MIISPAPQNPTVGPYTRFAPLSPVLTDMSKNSIGNERGNAILELAIVIVLLVVILGGILNYGVALQEHAVMVDSARMAARAAGKARGADGAQLQTIATRTAETFLQEFGYPVAEYTVRVRDRDLGAAAGWGIKVTITRPAVGIRYVFNQGGGIGRGFGSCASSVFRVESNTQPTANAAPGDEDC